MIRRIRRIRRLTAAALVAACLLAGCGSGSTSAHHVPAPSPALGTVVDAAVPDAIRHIPLTRPDGTTTTLAAYQGRPVMIADYLTLCVDICPLITANTVAMARALQADGAGGTAALLEISVDPARDTPARLRAYQKLYGGAHPGWELLRASPADTRRLWQFFHVYYRHKKEEQPPARDWLTHRPLTYDVVHEDALIFLDAAGRERFVVNSAPDASGSRPPGSLVHFLDHEGVDRLEHPDPTDSWTAKQGLGVLSWLLDRPLPPVA